MFPVNYALAFFGLLIASVFDLKTREIPDWLNFSMVGVGFGSAVIFSIMFSTWKYIAYSAIGFTAALLMALFFYRAGQWGGGDAKALMGLGALMGLELGTRIPLFVILVLNILIIGAVYGTIWSLVLTFRHKKAFKEEFRKLVYSPKVITMRKAVITVSMMGLVLFFLADVLYKPFMLGITAFIFFAFYFFIYSKAVEKACMEKDVRVSKLTEGDWIVGKVLVKKNSLESPYNYFLRKSKKRVKTSYRMIFIEFLMSVMPKGTAEKMKKLYAKNEKKYYSRLKEQWENEYNRLLDDLLDQESIRKIIGNKSSKGIYRWLFGSSYPKKLRKKIDKAMQKTKPVSELDRAVFRRLEEHGYYADKELICSSKDKDGLTKDQIKLLSEKKIRKVIIKEGIPFLPSFFIAYVITMLAGNWLIWVI